MTETPTEVQEVENGPEDSVEAPPAEAKPAETTEKKGKRAKLPTGYDTPINFAHALTKRLQEEGKLAEDAVFRPQVVYSYLKNRSKVDPFPVHFVQEDGTELEADDETTRPALKVEDDGTFKEAMDWWDRKEERNATKATNAKEKAAKKAEKAPATPAEAAPSEFEAGEVVEAE